MAQLAAPVTGRRWPALISTVLIGIVCFGLLISIYGQLTSQVFNALPVPHLVLAEDIPLPSVLPTRFIPDLKNPSSVTDPLAPGVAVRFDHFDFQALDPRTKLLFIAHSGPVPDKFTIANPHFNPDKDSKFDGNVVVFDTTRNKVIALVAVPQIAGIVAAPDLGRVFAADANDNIIYSIDEKTLKATAIQLDTNEGPDAVEYDPDDHKVFVSDPGVPNPDNIDRKNQNLSVIDLLTNKVSKINLGFLPKLPAEHADLVKWGYDVGHDKYDPGLRRVFVTIQQLTDMTNTKILHPPAGTGELVAIDPVTQQVVGRVQLPNTCGIPHGMSIDTQQHIAYIACTDVNPNNNLVQNLARVDLQTMTVIQGSFLLLASKPDIVVYSSALHTLFVACSGGVSVFTINGRQISKLGDYNLGKGTHTLAVNAENNTLYLPLIDVGGRPILRIVKYIPGSA